MAYGKVHIDWIDGLITLFIGTMVAGAAAYGLTIFQGALPTGVGNNIIGNVLLGGQTLVTTQSTNFFNLLFLVLVLGLLGIVIGIVQLYRSFRRSHE